MFFIGFNRKWTSSQPCQRKLAVFGSLFYTCMLVKTQLYFLIWKIHQVIIPSGRKTRCSHENSHLFFSTCFYKCKKKTNKQRNKESENTPQSELIRNKVKPGQCCWYLFDMILHHVSPMDGWNLSFRRLLCFSCHSNQPLVFVLFFCSLSIHFFLKKVRVERVKNYCCMLTFSHSSWGDSSSQHLETTHKSWLVMSISHLHFCPITTLTDTHTHTQVFRAVTLSNRHLIQLIIVSLFWNSCIFILSLSWTTSDQRWAPSKAWQTLCLCSVLVRLQAGCKINALLLGVS